MSRVQVAGFPGLVLVAGFVWMLCTGLPGVAPVVGVLAGLGVMAGGVLLIVRRRQKSLPTSPLREAAATESDAPSTTVDRTESRP